MASRAFAVTSSRAFARSTKLKNDKRPVQWLVQTRTKRSAATNKKAKKDAVSRAIASSRKQSADANPGPSATAELLGASQEELFRTGVFGLRPIDYAVLPPIRRSPPPPPPRTGPRRLLYPFVLLVFGGTIAYFYANNKNDNYTYWEAMQTGEAMPMDDDDEEEEEEEEEEEYEEDGQVEAEENVEQLQQLNAARAGGGGEDDVDGSKSTQRRGWFGWLRGWKRGNGGDETDPSVR